MASELQTTTATNNVQKAAILLLTLGEQDAAEVLKHMGPKEVQKLGETMAGLRNVTKDQVNDALASFMNTVEQQTSLGVGANDAIRRMFHKALGTEKADALIDRIMFGDKSTGLEHLKWMDARSIADMIGKEHPQIIAIVLAFLDRDQASEVLSLLPKGIQHDVVLRVATLDSIHPSALDELNAIMEKQVSSNKATQSPSVGGTKVAADLLNYLDASVEEEILNKVKEADEDLGIQIEELMFVFESLTEMDGRSIQALLREISSESLILALKGADETVKSKFFGNMSKRAAEMLREDLEAKGPVRISDVELAQKEILAVARRMAEAGEIALGGKGGDEYV